MLDEQPPTSAPQGALVFEATGSEQRFIVTADAEADGALIAELRSADGVSTIMGRVTKVEDIDEVVIYLEGIDDRQ